MYIILLFQLFVQIIASINISYYPKRLQIGDTVHINCVFENLKFFEKSFEKLWIENYYGIYDGYYGKFYFNWERNVMTLKIVKITEFILNSTYACEYRYQKKSIMFNINENTFIYKPKKNESSIYNTNDTIILKLKKVFPVPKCYLKTDNKNKLFEKKYVNKINKFYYEIIQSVNFDNRKHDVIEILCIVNDDFFEINHRIRQKPPPTFYFFGVGSLKQDQ